MLEGISRGFERVGDVQKKQRSRDSEYSNNEKESLVWYYKSQRAGRDPKLISFGASAGSKSGRKWASQPLQVNQRNPVACH
jgi:hypothetical protein